MTAKKLCNFYLDPELLEGLKAMKERDGASEGESVRRALVAYLKKQGVIKKTAPRRAPTRRRA